MQKTVRSIIRLLLALLLVSITTGALVSKVYWGYWFAPPSVKPWVADLRSVDAIGYLTCEPGRAATVKAVLEAAVNRLATNYVESSPDYPTYQLPWALHAASSSVPATTPTTGTVQPLCDLLLPSSFIVDGDAGYVHAHFVHGFLIFGTRRSDDHVAILSAIGGEVSNDQHAVYDVEFIEHGSQLWRVLRYHQYFEDIAGLEGMRWFPIALLCFIAGLSLTIVVVIGVWSTRLIAKRVRGRKQFGY